MRFQAPRGTEDVLPAASAHWQRVERRFLEMAGLYGYREIRTPAFEDYELFVRTSGETSDVVSKQMYDFFDKGERHICLKAEGTAPAMRAVVEHSLCPPGTALRLAYITPVFRYERPQKGRLREHHQLGAELLGVESPAADAEVIELAYRFLSDVGLSGLVVQLNSLGRDECREQYRAAVLNHAEPVLATLPPDAAERARQNPLRLLDSKDEAIKSAMTDAPSVLDYLEDSSRERFEELQGILREAGVPFEIDPQIVRGLDYYTETVFEVLSDQLGSQSAVCGGGRYDKLVQEIGGSPTPSVGFGMGIERLLMLLEQAGKLAEAPAPDVAIVFDLDSARGVAFIVARELRAAGLGVAIDLDGRSFKSQFRQADRSGARFAVVLGEDEAKAGTATVKDLQAGSQELVPRADLVRLLKERCASS